MTRMLLLWCLVCASVANATDSRDDQALATLLLKKANTVMEHLERANYQALSTHVHESLSVRFSPYARNVRKLSITQFRKAQLARFKQDQKVYVWGYYDGIGSRIQLKPMQYHARFIHDIDYRKMATPKYIAPSQVASNPELPGIAKEYPGASLIYYEYQGSRSADYKDRKGLLFLFAYVDSQWYLIGIAHDEETV